MLKKFSYNIAYFFVQKNVIPMDNIEIYQYGLEQIFSTVYTVATILAIAALTNHLISSVIFLIFFVSLRKYTGGYHASTYLKCYLGFTLIYIVFLMVLDSGFLESHMPVTLISLAVSVLVIAICSPIEHKNKPISKENKVKYKKLAAISLTAELLMMLLLFSLHIKYFSTMILTVILVAILQIVAVIHNKYFILREQNDKNSICLNNSNCFNIEERR